MKEKLSQIENVIRDAGQILKNASLSKDQVFDKEGPANFVTLYDKKIQDYLIDRLKTIIPEAAYYGEEDTDGNGCSDVNSGYVFFIDPIDGTTNFIFDYRHSCVSVGLSLDGEIIAGFVYDPYNDIMYKGIKNEGTYFNDKRILIEDTKISDGICEFGAARYNDDRVDLIFDVCKELFLRSLCVRNGGSAAIGISKVGTGSNVIYFELLLQPYDYAAASIIVTEAGGRICQVNGDNITLDKGGSIIAGTKSAVREVIDIVDRLNN